MDDRCPRKLSNNPDNWCGLAVLRLKAIRNANRELTEEEEGMLPGCAWCIGNQLANYCFFKYIEELVPDRTLSDIEIASMLNLSVETVRKTERLALNKMKRYPQFVEIADQYGDEAVVDDDSYDY